MVAVRPEEVDQLSGGRVGEGLDQHLAASTYSVPSSRHSPCFTALNESFPLNGCPTETG